ncbi:MAG: hypothetical protein JNJ90_05075 [Saprospiraceae bacterium]|jgi:hypothetical protein|nr:hypothetical protein [Saprospiraceae bacterium]
MKNNVINSLLLGLFLSTGVRAQDPLWVRDNTWYFDNFTQAEVGWDVFRETFIGVAPAPSGDFDLLLFETIYKQKLFETGHCFGIDLLAMMMLKNGGHLGYCHPPYVYAAESPSPADGTVGPSDTILRRAIQIMHGHQITHRFLLFLLDVIAQNQQRNGNYAYQQYVYYTAKNDPCLISVTKSVSPADGAHVVVPFFAEDLGGGTKRLYVYDPNRSYYEAGAAGHDYYHNRQNFIEITAGGNWTFTMDGGEVYTGNPGSGGNCVVIPVSVAGKKDRLPQSLFAEGAYALNSIFIFGKNTRLRQLALPETNRQWLNAQGDDLEPDPDCRMTNVVPFIPQTGGRPDTTDNQLWFIQGNEPFEITLEAGTEAGYRVGFMGTQAYLEIESPGAGQDRLRIEGIGTAAPVCTWMNNTERTRRVTVRARRENGAF